jgi:aminoglycoside phosphotransferase family enzyme/predicted kinase
MWAALTAAGGHSIEISVRNPDQDAGRMTQVGSHWIDMLLRAEAFDHPVTGLRLIETHISWVILTGSLVYKLKKPVDLGFLDFSSLEKRKACADAEVRLNQRLAPGIYLGVVPVTGSRDNPHMEGDGPLLDWAVKMVQFPQQAQLDRMLASGVLSNRHIDAFAARIAEFHLGAESVPATEGYGSPDAVLGPVAENFEQIRASGVLAGLPAEKTGSLEALESWSRSQWHLLAPVFVERKALGFIRQCHGDLHLRNLAWIDDAPVAFDCIEFNPNLSRIDVLSDVAFLVMDLQDRGEQALASRFLNEYLQHTGDYLQLQVLPWYLTYRALVRAKVTAIRLSQPDLADVDPVRAEFDAYLQLASSYASHPKSALLLTCGLSGSGKTTVTAPLLEKLGAIRIRSDVERKRLHGLRAEESGRAAPGGGIYDQQSSQQTYSRLLLLARHLLQAGFTVIVDATFLDRTQRQPFARLAVELDCNFLILALTAPADVLRQRVAARRGDASDADVAVLEAQLSRWRGLEPDERALTIDTSKAEEVSRLPITVQRALQSRTRDQ